MTYRNRPSRIAVATLLAAHHHIDPRRLHPHQRQCPESHPNRRRPQDLMGATDPHDCGKVRCR